MQPQKMKAQDFRNASLLFPFTIISGIEPVNDDAMRVRRIWALLAAIQRILRIPKEELKYLSDKRIKGICDTFYNLWVKVFGLRSAVYNIHVTGAHIMQVLFCAPCGAITVTKRSLFQIRNKDEDSATEKSAYGPESSYSITRNDFEPGTDNICKQILTGCLLRFSSPQPHCCRRSAFPKF